MTIDDHQAIVRVHLVGNWYFVDDCSVAAAAVLAALVDLRSDDTADVAVVGLGHYHPD